MLGEILLQLMAGSSVVVALGKPKKRFSIGSLVLLSIICVDKGVTWGDSKRSLRKVWIDVEGSVGPYY